MELFGDVVHCYTNDVLRAAYDKPTKSKEVELDGFICHSPLMQRQEYFAMMKMDGPKALDFEPVFDSLGATFDLNHLSEGTLLVKNTEKRAKEITDVINEVLATGRLTPKEALSLRGRLAFAEGQLFGRGAQCALRVVGARGLSRSGSTYVDDSLSMALLWLRDRVLLAPPRRILSTLPRIWYVFTDGACEPSGTSVGGVLIDSDGRLVSHFGENVPQALTSLWALEGSEQHIAKAELLPLLLSYDLWRGSLSGCAVVFYLDNDGSRHSIISGRSDSSLCQRIVDAILHCEAEMEVTPWYGRVPSISNVADGPSRLDFAFMKEMGCPRACCQFALRNACRQLGADGHSM